MSNVRAESRRLTASLVLLVALLGCDRNAPTPAVAGKQGTPPDLRAERAARPTVLRVRGPAPQPFRPETPPAGVRQIVYRSGDLELVAWLAAPHGPGPHPAVVYCHGGFAFDADDWEQSKPFRDAGYAVLMPMLRGENGNPGHFEMFFGEVDDAIAAGRHLAAQPGVDPARVYIAGHSAGGTVAMLAAQLPSPFAAAASFDGPPEMQYLLANPRWRGWAPFDPDDEAERRLRSPVHFVGGLTCPLRVFVASDEVYVNAVAGMGERAGAHGKTCTVEVLTGDHVSIVPEAIRRTIAHFAAARAPSPPARSPGSR